MRPAFSWGYLGYIRSGRTPKSGSDFGNAILVKRLHDDPLLGQLDRFTSVFEFSERKCLMLLGGESRKRL
jgi:hypothetical protein